MVWFFLIGMFAALLHVMVVVSSCLRNSLAKKLALSSVISLVAQTTKFHIEIGWREQVGQWSVVWHATNCKAEM